MVHARSARPEAGHVPLRLLTAVRMSCELLDDEVATPLVQMVAPDLCPLCRKIAPGPVKGIGDVEDVLPGMEDVDDLDRVRDMLVGEVPDPGRPVPEDGPALDAEEPASPGLAQHPPDEGNRLPIRVVGSD